jgi:hypothetical protein
VRSIPAPERRPAARVIASTKPVRQQDGGARDMTNIFYIIGVVVVVLIVLALVGIV